MRRTSSIRTLPLALVTAMLVVLGSTAAVHAMAVQDAQTAPASKATVEPSSPKPVDAVAGSTSETQDYARRQNLNPGLSEFAGGHEEEVIVIGSCGCLLAVLVIILVLL